MSLLSALIYFSCGTTNIIYRPETATLTVISSKVITPGTGGEVSANVQNVSVNVSIPAGALSMPTTITIAEIQNPPSIQGFSNGGVFLDFGPSGLIFTTPVTVTINYNINNYPLGIDENTIKLYTYENNNWVAVPTQSTNAAGDYIVAQLNHFSFYAPMSSSGNYDLQVNISPLNSGFVSPSISTYAQNTTATLYASPQSGYIFSHWSGDLSGSSNPAYLMMNSNKNITAVFNSVSTSNPVVTPSFSLTTSVSPLNSGLVSPSSGIFMQNTLVSIYATPNSGYQFSYWIGEVTNTANASTTILMDNTKNIQAVFTALPTSNPFVTPSYPLITTVSPNGSGVVSPSSGTYLQDTIVPLTATANSGYQFAFWAGDISDVNNYVNVTMNATKNIIAVFTQLPTSNPIYYPLYIDIWPTGSALVTPSAGLYPAGTTLNLFAVGQNGYTFSFWMGNIPTSNANPMTLIMDSTKNIYVIVE